MNNLRLIAKTNEFYKDRLPIVFLNDVKDINIIIGANNTRKSRFLRLVISQKNKAVFNLNHDLNKAYFESLHLFDDAITVMGKDLIENIIQVQILASSQDDEQYTHIKSYFDSNSQTSFNKIRNDINKIYENLLEIDSPTHFSHQKTEFRRLYFVVKAIEDIYAALSERDYISVNQNQFTGTMLRYLTYITPSQQHGYALANGPLKFSTLTKVRKNLEMLIDMNYQACNEPIILIPVLRTSRTLSKNGDDIFETAILQQHFPTKPEKLQIHTGLKLYRKISLARNGTRQQSRDFREFEKFIGNVFFRSPDIHIVAHQSDEPDKQVIHVTLPQEMEDIPIHDLGDGVQAVINLLFPVFTAEEGSWIFIDEPENHLHPGYQNVFMSAIMGNESIKKKRLRFFINTHSNHILSGAMLGALDAEVFVFSRKDSASSEINSFNGNELNTLEALGVLNTSVLISNCTVWVEGVTDRHYLQAFLYAYCQQNTAFIPVEGLHYSFVEYGGKNLTHYNFDHKKQADAAVDKNKIEAYFINSNVFLLADSDFDEHKYQKYDAIQRKNFVFCKTELPEIENLIPDKLVMAYLIEKLRCNLEDVTACFSKPDRAVKLGSFLKDKIHKGKNLRDFEGGGGTLAPRYKKGLADFVHTMIMERKYTWEDLAASPKLVQIVQCLHQFIDQKNPIPRA
ncbi:AAA family ATPase [Mucilaginibacter sp. AW1-7]|uniref:AAA family ATPase n=1 Tax=Mucilaginibacter sp. AW1-7 TaxID=3349874 RepID=UPI003F7350E2